AADEPASAQSSARGAIGRLLRASRRPRGRRAERRSHAPPRHGSRRAWRSGGAKPIGPDTPAGPWRNAVFPPRACRPANNLLTNQKYFWIISVVVKSWPFLRARGLWRSCARRPRRACEVEGSCAAKGKIGAKTLKINNP